MTIAEWLKIIIVGIVEGVTEWLPISSTGHMILVDAWLHLQMEPAFREMFLVVIQLGAILAVVGLYFRRLWPVAREEKMWLDHGKLTLWAKIIIASVPAGVIGILFDDRIEEMFFNERTVAAMLILYGALYILVEMRHKGKEARIQSLDDLGWLNAFWIGCFQALALIPGTSRSGSTILGGILLGASRTIAAEFTFFLAIPAMFGASLLKLAKFGWSFSSLEWLTLAVGMTTAFAVSVVSIRFLLGYIKRHDFKVFGVYRILLGVIVIILYAWA